jgi:hypothetical protein
MIKQLLLVDLQQKLGELVVSSTLVLQQGSPTFFGCGHLEGHFNSKRAECKKI